MATINRRILNTKSHYLIAIRILNIPYVRLLYSETVRFANEPLNLDEAILLSRLIRNKYIR